MKRMVIETGSVVGVELSGHIFLRALNGRDDPLYTALVLSAYLADQPVPLSNLVDRLPPISMTPDIRVDMPEDRIRRIIEKCRKGPHDSEVQTIDGVRLIWPTGWLLVRRSITEPKITIRIEGERPDDVREIGHIFVREFPDLSKPVAAAIESLTG